MHSILLRTIPEGDAPRKRPRIHQLPKQFNQHGRNSVIPQNAIVAEAHLRNCWRTAGLRREVAPWQDWRADAGERFFKRELEEALGEPAHRVGSVFHGSRRSTYRCRKPGQKPGHLTSALIQARAGCEARSLRTTKYKRYPSWHIAPCSKRIGYRGPTSRYYVSLHSFHFAFTAKCFV